MCKIAYLFPGQGAQYVGMGRELYDNYAPAKAMMDSINSLLGMDMLNIIFNGPEDELKKTEYTQPAILSVSLSVMKILDDMGIKPNGAVGLSLGEYGALTASGTFTTNDVIPLVRKRGKLMQEAVPQGIGTMAAIIGLDRESLNKVVKEASNFGIVETVNYNCPGQVSIAGEILAVGKAVEIAKSAGAARSVVLQVSAPFHSIMLKSAGEALNMELKKVTARKGSIPVISNVDANYYKFETEEIIDKLTRQVYNPVLFEDSIKKLISDGFDTFIEIGPGRALSSFVKRISKDVKIFNIEDIKSLEKTISGLGM